MPSILLTPPAIEPISLADAKAFLRVEHDDDDDVIAALISGARMYVETQTRRALIAQTWRVVLDNWPASGRIDVRPAPLRSLIAARVYDAQGNAEALDLDVFVEDVAGSALIFPSWALVQPGRIAAGIEFDVSVGHGDTVADVPELLRQAVRLLLAHWYDNRSITDLPILPATVPALIAPYRMVAL